MKLTGKRTYLIAGLMVATVVARLAGLIDEQTYETFYSLLAALALGALRAGVGKAGGSTAPAGEEEVTAVKGG